MKALMIFLLFSLAVSTSAYYTNINYTVSEDYSINFTTKKANGTMTGLSGVVNFKEEDIETASMNVKVDVATIKTGNKLKDKHARGSKWFDVKKYQTINFVSESVSKTNNQYQVTGTLTIKDVSQKHTIDFQVEKNDNTTYLIGTTTVDRNEFNIEGNRFGFLVGDEVKVDLRVPANFKEQT